MYNNANDQTVQRKKRSLSEWLNDFLEADAQQNAEQYAQWEADDWDAGHQHEMPGPDGEYYGDEELDDGIFESLAIVGLAAVLGVLVYWRQQRQLEARRRQEAEQGQGQAQGDGQVAGQQQDGGFFPPPGDPNFNAWAAGGVGH